MSGIIDGVTSWITQKFTGGKWVNESNSRVVRDALNTNLVNDFISTTELGLLRGVEFDDVQVTYPNSVTENYYFYLSTVLQKTIEVTYVNASKETLLRARVI